MGMTIGAAHNAVHNAASDAVDAVRPAPVLRVLDGRTRSRLQRLNAVAHFRGYVPSDADI